MVAANNPRTIVSSTVLDSRHARSTPTNHSPREAQPATNYKKWKSTKPRTAHGLNREQRARCGNAASGTRAKWAGKATHWLPPAWRQSNMPLPKLQAFGSPYPNCFSHFSSTLTL